MKLLSAFLLGLTIIAASGDMPSTIDETELVRRLTQLEREAARAEPSEVAGLVRRFAREMAHQRVRVHSARVIQTYERVGWRTRPYFAVNYLPDDYTYLDELDQTFQDELAGHLHWVSIVKSLPDRQLMFELAIDDATFEALERDDVVTFTCELAGVIRGGKSVYCRMLELEPPGS